MNHASTGLPLQDRIASLENLPVDGRRVFLRVDLNVPLQDGQVADDSRIRAILPTLRTLADRGCRVVLASHLGRPEGKRDKSLSMEPVGARLAALTGYEVLLADAPVGDGARKVASDLRDGQVAMLENLRFHPGERKNDADFARELLRMADVYVNDAFGASHRAHASVEALPRMVATRGAGTLFFNELKGLGRLLREPERPFVALLGGAKVSDKIGVLEKLLPTADAILVGGAMANTLLAARGTAMGRSKIEEAKLPVARSLLELADRYPGKLHLPTDVVGAFSFSETSNIDVLSLEDGMPDARMALDIGPATCRHYREILLKAATVFWNGPVGVFERAPFDAGTVAMAHAVADCPGYTVVGGGDSLAAIHRAGTHARYGHVSTGGGASLELLEGRSLPGIEALRVTP